MPINYFPCSQHNKEYIKNIFSRRSNIVHFIAHRTYFHRKKLGKVMSAGMKFVDGQLIIVVPADQFAPTIVGIRLGAINLEDLL